MANKCGFDSWGCSIWLYALSSPAGGALLSAESDQKEVSSEEDARSLHISWLCAAEFSIWPFLLYLSLFLSAVLCVPLWLCNFLLRSGLAHFPHDSASSTAHRQKTYLSTHFFLFSFSIHPSCSMNLCLHPQSFMSHPLPTLLLLLCSCNLNTAFSCIISLYRFTTALASQLDLSFPQCPHCMSSMI